MKPKDKFFTLAEKHFKKWLYSQLEFIVIPSSYTIVPVSEHAQERLWRGCGCTQPAAGVPAGSCHLAGIRAAQHKTGQKTKELQTDRSENPVNRSHPRARHISGAFLWHTFPATHLNIMLNSFRASSVTPVVFLKRKTQSS